MLLACCGIIRLFGGQGMPSTSPSYSQPPLPPLPHLSQLLVLVLVPAADVAVVQPLGLAVPPITQLMTVVTAAHFGRDFLWWGGMARAEGRMRASRRDYRRWFRAGCCKD